LAQLNLYSNNIAVMGTAELARALAVNRILTMVCLHGCGKIGAG